MSDISALNSSLSGIQKGLAGMRKNAAEIARTATEGAVSSEQLTTSLVAMKENELQIKASAKVLQTSHDLIGSLFDDKA